MKDEKEEKKQRQAKYETLNTNHFETIESFSKERLMWSRKVFLTLGISIAMAVLLIIVLLPSITNLIQNL